MSTQPSLMTPSERSHSLREAPVSRQYAARFLNMHPKTVLRRNPIAGAGKGSGVRVSAKRERSNARLRSTRSSKAGDQHEDVVAHISPHVFYVVQGQRGGCQGCTGAVAALNGKDDVGHLHPGPESAEASGAKQGNRHYPLATKLYRRCTASFWGNPGNSLIRLASPTGFEPVLPP
jgi:hypothetical protein